LSPSTLGSSFAGVSEGTTSVGVSPSATGVSESSAFFFGLPFLATFLSAPSSVAGVSETSFVSTSLVFAAASEVYNSVLRFDKAEISPIVDFS
jgi:hypothetical protein